VARRIRPGAAFPGRSRHAVCRLLRHAEFGCFKALNWPQPGFVLDLFTEFKASTNGLNPPNGVSR
jgi:hypothetical protein